MEIGTRIIDSAGRIRRRFGRVLLCTVVGTVVLLRVPIFCRVVVYYWSRCRTPYFILGTHETEKNKNTSIHRMRITHKIHEH